MVAVVSVMLSVFYLNFKMGEWSLHGPGTDGQEGVHPGWKAEGIDPDRRGAEATSQSLSWLIVFGNSWVPPRVKMRGCCPAWRWLLRNVNKSLKINTLPNFCHSRLFVQFIFFSKQCLQANPGKISTFTFLLIRFLWVVVSNLLDCLLEGTGSVKINFILICFPGYSPQFQLM